MSAGFSSSDHRLHPHTHNHTMVDNENLFHFPLIYDDSDDEHLAHGITRRFLRSASLRHQPLFIFKDDNRVFSSASSPDSQQPPPFFKTNDEAWNLIYATAGQVARMKMTTAGAPRNTHPASPWGRSSTDGYEFFRQQQQLCRTSAWPPPQLQNQQCLHNAPTAMKPVGSGGGGATRECAGTGVFLPRRFRHNYPPESPKRQAAGSTNFPATMIQSSTKTFVPITTPPQIQARINGVFFPNYEMLVRRRNAMIVAAEQRRRSNNIHGGVMESPVNNPEVLLPQEWTY